MLIESIINSKKINAKQAEYRKIGLPCSILILNLIISNKSLVYNYNPKAVESSVNCCNARIKSQTLTVRLQQRVLGEAFIAVTQCD